MAKNDFIWAVMFKLGGNNMCGDAYLTQDWVQKNPKIRHRIRYTELFFDESIWRTATEKMQKAGMNMALIDMHEGVVYPRHPEIAVKGSWNPEKFRAELKRLRDMGITPVPKLNFSTTHAAWQGEWRYLTSTPEYYKFCDDMIQDVCELFDTPPLFHLGMDEELPAGQRHDPLCIIRQGDLWWHDFDFLVRAVEKRNVRAWIWSDKQWTEQDEFAKRCPKSVMQSNWYYGKDFSDKKKNLNPAEILPKGGWASHQLSLRGYVELEKYGYEQIATGSNWSFDENIALTHEFCKKHIAPARYKGLMTASWKRCLPGDEGVKLLASIDQIAAVKASVKA
ncbi:MAG: Tat pathway signal protein [Kiritimatiellae bacterium]|nr:Tat pathway signal protein [Kiritimatiellia bacterium]